MVITVCIGSSCHLKGARPVVEALQELIAKNGLQSQVEMKGQFCMGDCMRGVCVTVDGQKFSVQPENAEQFFNEHVLRALR